jgi:hypothetical protein
MAPSRTAAVLARQQAGWLRSRRMAGLLTTDDILLARAGMLYTSMLNTLYWNERACDLAAAAEAAGLVAAKDGWGFAGGTTPPEARYLHPTFADDVLTRAELFGDAWAFGLRHYFTGVIFGREPSFEVITEFLWKEASSFTWTWWCCRLQDGDTTATISQRAITRWIEAEDPDLRPKWTIAEVGAAQRRWARQQGEARIDNEHVVQAAEGTRLRVTET